MDISYNTIMQYLLSIYTKQKPIKYCWLLSGIKYIGQYKPFKGTVILLYYFFYLMLVCDTLIVRI